ncbi:hypothetical protein [Endozoicomonas arenosclerae]|uniref:hypothetical protein n=1 Tax=Endozoicomonas arenosclerae TaxID=1633495 RepID=UPI0007849EC6|nr:hypothetical protein [Endozoicomonas arenosclerae]
MKTVLLAALLLVCFVSTSANAAIDSNTVVQNIATREGEKAVRQGSSRERIQLPMGVLQKAPDGWVYWDGADAHQVDYYQTSSIYSYLYSVATYVAMAAVTAMVGGYSPLELRMISLLTTFGFVVDLGLTTKQAYRVYSLYGQSYEGIWQVPFRDRKEPPLLILLNQHSVGRVHYTVFSLYDEEASDLRYIDDAYLKLAKVLYKRQIYLTLTPMEEEPEEGSTLKDELARDSDLAVSIFQNANREYFFHVDFSGSPSLPWQELSLSRATGAELDRQYLSAISPLWIGHVADWLTKPENWRLMGKYLAAQDDDLSELGEMPEQPGPWFEDDELGVNNMLVSDAGSGCMELDMGSMISRLPASGVLLGGDQHCLSIGRKDILRSAEHDVSKSYTYNQFEAQSTFLKWTVLKKLQVAALNWGFMNGVRETHKAYIGWKNSKAITTLPPPQTVPPEVIPPDDIAGNEVVPAPQAPAPAKVAAVVSKSMGLQDHLVLAELERRTGLSAAIKQGIQLRAKEEQKPVKEKEFSAFEKRMKDQKAATEYSDDESDDDFEFDDEEGEEVAPVRPRLVVAQKKPVTEQPVGEGVAVGDQNKVPAPPVGAPPPPPPPKVQAPKEYKIKIKTKAQLAQDQAAKENKPKNQGGMDDVMSSMADILAARKKKLEALERQQQQQPPVEPVNVAGNAPEEPVNVAANTAPMDQTIDRKPPPVRPRPPKLKPKPSRAQVAAINDRLLNEGRENHLVLDQDNQQVEIFGHKLAPEHWKRFLAASRAASDKAKDQALRNAGNIPERGDDEWDGGSVVEIPYQWIIFMWRIGLIGENFLDQ